MLDPKEYAVDLVEKHMICRALYSEAKEHALIDVQNTIDALENLNYCTKTYILNRIEIDATEYYNQVLEHIKQL